MLNSRGQEWPSSLVIPGINRLPVWLIMPYAAQSREWYSLSNLHLKRKREDDKVIKASFVFWRNMSENNAWQIISARELAMNLYRI